jgi:class 3 adenylate cyclase/pimeloyl-ACP methyl ester carboxylesterase
MAAARIHHAQASGASIAYQRFGSCARTVVSIPSFAQNIELIWEQALAVQFFERFGSLARVIQFDKRGTGMSDRRVPPATLEDRVQDLIAVMDTERVERATIMGTSEGGSLAAFFAATYPERTEALVLKGSYASFTRRDDHPWLPTKRARLLRTRVTLPLWGHGLFTTNSMAPSMAGEPGFRRWAAKYEQQSLARSKLIAWIQMNLALDVRHVLPTIQAPTLVTHTSEDRLVPIQCSHYLAEHIPGAQFVELTGADHVPWFGAQHSFLDAVEDFFDRQNAPPRHGRALATVVFTDIVGSTELASRLGDNAWVELLERHDALVRDEIAAHTGRWVKSTGDGVLATFDGPSRAISFACRVRDRLTAECGIDIRAGLHTAEIELRDDDIGGVAVHEAARVQATARPREIVVSETVRALVNGSEIAFTDHGAQELKGIPGTVQLFSVATGENLRANL